MAEELGDEEGTYTGRVVHASQTRRRWARAARRAPKEAMADDQPRTGGASDLSKMTAICWKVEPLPTPAAGRDWVVVRS